MSSSTKKINDVVLTLQEGAPLFLEESKDVQVKAINLHNQFLARFPFHKNPSEIDNLTEADVYDPGSGDYFFYWVEHKLKILGHIAMGSSAPFRNASENLDKLRPLLKIAVDPKIRLHEKVDARWRNIKGLGGDRHVAKKIIYLYDVQNTYPIFKTEHFEYFLTILGVDVISFSNSVFGKSYSALSLGQKFETLNVAINDFKQNTEPFSSWDILTFSRLLYTNLAPPSSAYSSMSQVARPAVPLSNIGLLYAPRSEMEVIVLFSMYHRELGFPYISRVGTKFPDAEVLDESGEKKNVEFELFSRNFKIHRHPAKECDYIVCWDDNWRDAPDTVVEKIISLKERLKDVLQ